MFKYMTGSFVNSPYFVPLSYLYLDFCFVPMLFNLDSIPSSCVLVWGLVLKWGVGRFTLRMFTRLRTLAVTWELQGARLLSVSGPLSAHAPSQSHTTTELCFWWALVGIFTFTRCQWLSSPFVPRMHHSLIAVSGLILLTWDLEFWRFFFT